LKLDQDGGPSDGGGGGYPLHPGVWPLICPACTPALSRPACSTGRFAGACGPTLVGFVLLLVPAGLDGLAQMVNHLAELGQGIRDRIAWFTVLTGNALPAAFEAGDAQGSCNGSMRLIAGALFALGWCA
jgi:hypothetical protein